MIEDFQTTIRPVQSMSPGELEAVVAVAKADGHGTFGITHVIEKNKDCIGHLSICGAPMVLIWLHTTKAKPRDALRVMDFYENRIRDSGSNLVIVPCVKTSPLLPYMEKVGYAKGNETTIFMKGL